MQPAEIVAQYDKLVLSAANEASTRLKVINHVIYDVLGWTHADVSVEEKVSEDGQTTWADYVLRTGMTSIVIEAKKVGATFTAAPDTRRVKLNNKFLQGDLGAAITQARDYARKLSVPFAAITNGNSWIIFPATRIDQVPFHESSAVVFSDLASALDRDFSEFFDIFSRDAAIRGALEYELLGRVENQIEDHRLNRYFSMSFSKISRHSFFPLIEDAVATAFSQDIVNSSADLLERCYVKTPERVRFDERIRMHINKRDSIIVRATARPMRDGKNPIGDIVAKAAHGARPVAVLVLGTVGAGKTTFLEYTRKVGAEAQFVQSASGPYPHWLHIDFISFLPEESPSDFVYQALKRHIEADGFLSDYERCIKHAYKGEIDALFKGPLFLLSDDTAEQKRSITKLLMDDYAAIRPYVDKILQYAAQNSPIFLVVDNIDQIEDEEIQSGVFSEIMALAQKLKVNLICAMREATYIRHKNTPIFDAFDFDPITIDAPQISAVLSKRFFLTQQLLAGKSGDFVAENGAIMHMSDLSVVIDIVKDSVLGTEIGNLIDVLATSDVRMALRMTREFLQSGWTASGKALEIFQKQGSYIMPRHEALRAIMLGNQQIYSEEYSVIGNPFDSRIAKTEAQLLRIYILAAIVQMGSERSFRHLEGLEVKEVCRQLGFGDLITLKVLQDLSRLRFIHTTSHSKPTLESNFIPSRLGGYVVRHFMSDMMFLENVMMDTFIPSNQAWDKLHDLTNDIYSTRHIIRRIDIRIERVNYFYNEMAKMFRPLREESVRRGLRKEWCSDPFSAAQNTLSTNTNNVRNSATRNYGITAQQS